MPQAFNNAGIFLVSTLFDLYAFILVIRLILVWVRADFFNPLSQFVVKLTQIIINPMRRIIPNLGKFELSTFVVILILEIVKYLIISFMLSGINNALGLVVLAFADIIKIILNIFFYAILLQAILSWVQPGYSPFSQVLMKITSPIMRPIQRVIPPLGGIDISPIPALILLQLLIILIVAPLFNLGTGMTFG